MTSWFLQPSDRCCWKANCNFSDCLTIQELCITCMEFLCHCSYFEKVCMYKHYNSLKVLIPVQTSFFSYCLKIQVYTVFL